MVTDAALPIFGGKTRGELLKAFAQGVEALLSAGRHAEQLGRLDGVALVGGFFGPLTGLECLQLASVHIAHHTQQLPKSKHEP